MWFRVYLVPDRRPLSVLVSPDGSLFFKADDLGLFLGYDWPFEFGRRTSRVTVKHVLPTAGVRSILSTRLLKLPEVLAILRRKRPRHPFDAELFERLWTTSRVERYEPIAQRPTPFGSPTVTAVPSGGACSLQDWIEDFRRAATREHERKRATPRTAADGPAPEAVVDEVSGWEEDPPPPPPPPPPPSPTRVDVSDDAIRSGEQRGAPSTTASESSSDENDPYYDWLEAMRVVTTYERRSVLPSPPPLSTPARLPAPERLLPAPNWFEKRIRIRSWIRDVRSALWPSTRDATPPPEAVLPADVGGSPSPPERNVGSVKFRVPLDNFEDLVVLEIDFVKK